MLRHQRQSRWHSVLTVGAVCGLAFAGTTGASDPEFSRVVIDSPSGRASVLDPESEESFQMMGVNTVKPGSSTIASKKLALQELQLDRLSDDSRSKAESVLKNLGMFRRLPTLSFEADPDVYEYFLRNPDVAVATWRAMEISKFNLQAVEANRYQADAGDGSVGQIELCYHTPEDTLIHCDGAFKSPLLPKPIVARSLMRLQTSFTKEADGRVIGTHSGDVFVEFPSQAVETVAKVISPISHSIADRNFKQMTLFVHLMSQAMARHPAWIESIGKKLEGVGDDRKREFLEISARSHAASRRRLNASARPMLLLNPDDMLNPFRPVTSSGALVPMPTILPVGASTFRE